MPVADRSDPAFMKSFGQPLRAGEIAWLGLMLATVAFFGTYSLLGWAFLYLLGFIAVSAVTFHQVTSPAGAAE